MNKSYLLSPETDISYVSSDKPNMDNMFPSFYDGLESGVSPRYSITSEWDNRSSTSTSYSGTKYIDMSSAQNEFSSSSIGSRNSYSSQNVVRQFSSINMSSTLKYQKLFRVLMPLIWRAFHAMIHTHILLH